MYEVMATCRVFIEVSGLNTTRVCNQSVASELLGYNLQGGKWNTRKTETGMETGKGRHI